LWKISGAFRPNRRRPRPEGDHRAQHAVHRPPLIDLADLQVAAVAHDDIEALLDLARAADRDDGVTVRVIVEPQEAVKGKRGAGSSLRQALRVHPPRPNTDDYILWRARSFLISLMIRRSFGVALVAALGVTLSGCGTIMNFMQEGAPGLPESAGHKSIYGGVTIDVDLIASSQGFAETVTALFLAGLIDLPLCLVMDTVTLPVTIPMTLSR
jgi:uncharacterized protein YceK